MRLEPVPERKPFYWGEKRWILQVLACLYLPQLVYWPSILPVVGFWKSLVYFVGMPLALPMMAADSLGISHEFMPLQIQGTVVMLLFLGVCWLVARAGRVWACAVGAVIVAESSLCALLGMIMANKSNEAGPIWISHVIAVALLAWLIGGWVKTWRHRGDQIVSEGM